LSFCTENDAFASIIISRYQELEIYHVSGENLYDIGAEGCTKANGVKDLASYFKIQCMNIASFGDDFNDVKMLRKCGTGIAVANAIDDARAAADFLCDTNDNDGVAKWLEDNVL
jgi:hydroxymethylpyrimidine pyrophosphatase-like HAD family hydrolase